MNMTNITSVPFRLNIGFLPHTLVIQLNLHCSITNRIEAHFVAASKCVPSQSLQLLAPTSLLRMNPRANSATCNMGVLVNKHVSKCIVVIPTLFTSAPTIYLINT